MVNTHKASKSEEETPYYDPISKIGGHVPSVPRIGYSKDMHLYKEDKIFTILTDR